MQHLCGISISNLRHFERSTAIRNMLVIYNRGINSGQSKAELTKALVNYLDTQYLGQKTYPNANREQQLMKKLDQLVNHVRVFPHSNQGFISIIHAAAAELRDLITSDTGQCVSTLATEEKPGHKRVVSAPLPIIPKIEVAEYTKLRSESSPELQVSDSNKFYDASQWITLTPEEIDAMLEHAPQNITPSLIGGLDNAAVSYLVQRAPQLFTPEHILRIRPDSAAQLADLGRPVLNQLRKSNEDLVIWIKKDMNMANTDTALRTIRMARSVMRFIEPELAKPDVQLTALDMAANNHMNFEVPFWLKPILAPVKLMLSSGDGLKTRLANCFRIRELDSTLDSAGVNRDEMLTLLIRLPKNAAALPDAQAVGKKITDLIAVVLRTKI